jgi:hypothetical protein
MPYADWVVSYGLNAWVIVVSGELSIVKVAVDDDEDEDLPPPGLGLDPQAASPPQMRAAAAMPVTVVCLSSFLMVPPAVVGSRQSEVRVG